MKKSIQFISFDDAWNKMEYKVIDILLEYGCLGALDKDAKILIGKIMMKYVLRKITTCSIDFDNTKDGLFTYLSTTRYPFVVFYLDESKITRDKEILEYYSYNEFVSFFKDLVRDINQVTNYKIIKCEFPYNQVKNISMGEITTTPAELELKKQILLQHVQQKKLPLKRIQEVASRYSVDLDELKLRKITS